MLSDISPALKARLGSNAANPDMWLRLMLVGPLHEMGVEYTEAIAVLLKRISSRMWDYTVSGVDARQAVRDRTTQEAHTHGSHAVPHGRRRATGRRRSAGDCTTRPDGRDVFRVS